MNLQKLPYGSMYYHAVDFVTPFLIGEGRIFAAIKYNIVIS